MSTTTIRREKQYDRWASASSKTRIPATIRREKQYDRWGFWALFAVMAQGAFNDNVLRFTMVYLLLKQFDGGGTMFGLNATDGLILGIGTVIFSLPFILFPGLVGSINDRYSKRSVAIASKVLELVLMLISIVAFHNGHYIALFALLFLMTSQSALFGPAKYGILPESLPESMLSWANGVFQMGTLIAVIAGTGVAGPLYKAIGGDVYLVGVFLAAMSALGVLVSWRITRLPPANPGKRITLNPWDGLWVYARVIWADRVLFHVIVGYIYFWFAGQVMQLNITVHNKGVLDPGFFEQGNSVCLAMTALGIGAGSMAAGILSRRRIELGLVPIGALGLAVFGGLLSVADFGFGALVLMMFGMGFWAGFFDVPLAASLQQRSPDWAKGGILATSNMLTFCGMMTGGVLFWLFGEMRVSSYGVFLFIGIFSLLVGGYMVHMVSMIPVRTLLWILNSTLYRTRVLGRERIPDQGGALWVARLASFVDALALYGATDRQVHFVVGRALVEEQGWLGRIARRIGVIAYDPDDPDSVARARASIREHIANGHVVCLTTEGPLDAGGARPAALEDYPALLEGLNVPVVPVHVDHLWGRLYTFADGRFRWKRPPYLPYPVTVHVGEHLPPTVTGAEVRDEIARLGVEAYTQRPLPFPLLHHGFIRAARRNRRKMAVADLTTGELSYFKTLIGSIVFARKLAKRLDGQPMVGVLVPPSIGGLLTNVALQMMGRVPINLNYTASNDALASCARQCGITQVITSKKVLERLPIQIPGETVFLEDIRETVTGKDRIVGLVIALAAPIRWIERMLGAPKRTSDDVATIIFSSGSEGEPKGVMLSHRNLIYDMEASMEVFPHDEETCLVGFLPFFHSFGYMATLWMVLCHGLRGVYHPNPLEPKQIGGLVEKYRATILIGTSTFLQSFIRRCAPEQLKTLAFVVCGAEKLSPRVRDAFREKFGVEPLEGYGTTECAPAVSVNIPDLVSPGFHFQGTRRGSIGRLIPGQSAKVEDPDTGVELPLGESGLLCIKGPNIMLGYLDQPGKTAKVLKDGWYATGDIAARDIDGFITITDRLARFSKIAGEMVPHTKVEETLHTLIGLTEQAMAIASVPDTQKGERLVVLHTLTDEQLAELTARLDQTGLPNLWVPRANAFYRIDTIPVLGTGKMDIKSVKQMALALDLGE